MQNMPVLFAFMPYFRIRNIGFWFVFAFFLVFYSSCQNKEKVVLSYNLRIEKTEYAKGFSIGVSDSLRIVSVLKPWQDEKKLQFRYVLHPKPHNKPDQNQEWNVQIPVRKVVCMSTTHLAFLEAIGQLNSVCAISGASFVCNPELRLKLENKQIIDVGYEGNLDYESIIRLKPDLVFMYGVNPSAMSMAERLMQIGVKPVFVGEYLESHPLAKSEWIKFFASFFGKQALADSIFTSVKNQYEANCKLVLNIGQKPNVLAGYPWKDVWYISGGNTYLARLIEDAGGNYIFKQVQADVWPASLETVFIQAAHADIWINSGEANSLNQLVAPDERLKLFRPFLNRKVYNNTLQVNSLGGNNYWEKGIMEPHLILLDLARIFHPSISNDTTWHYYRQLK